ncbi:MAG TPA: CAP domain-containing protein [Patescibacteria group bacterium]|nr:CAP domain-containing protein [Patescibacteria group bacterium]
MTLITALALLINLNRSTPLRISPTLTEVAQIRAAQAYLNFSHDGFAQPFDQTGYYGHVGENLAEGFNVSSTLFRAVLIDDAFLNSPEHRQNLLNPSWKDVGIGVYKNVVAVEFGYRNKPTISEQSIRNACGTNLTCWSIREAKN